jgi:hypothetical protein
MTIFLFVVIFQCTPIRYTWEGWKGTFQGPHRCTDLNTVAVMLAAFNIAQDAIILVLPLPLIYRLNTSVRSRINIAVMFSLGAFILITSCVRLKYIGFWTRSSNPTWSYTDVFIWSNIEVSVSVIVTSLPAIRALLGHLIPRVFGSSARSASDSMNSEAQTLRWSRSTAGWTTQASQRNTMVGSPRTATWLARSPRLQNNEERMDNFLYVGDKVKGEVLTEIRVDERPTAPGTPTSPSPAGGIYVTTTRTTTVEPDERQGLGISRTEVDPDRISVVDPAKADQRRSVGEEK